MCVEGVGGGGRNTIICVHAWFVCVYVFLLLL